MSLDFNELLVAVEAWSHDKGIDQADPRAQFLKCVEEVGEVAAAMARGNHLELVDGIGDVLVTFIILAQQHGVSAQECLWQAYQEIRGRQGVMRDGVFVKEGQ